MSTTPPTVAVAVRPLSTMSAPMNASSANSSTNVALCNKHVGALSVLGVKVGET